MDGSRQLIWCNDYDRPDTYFVESGRDENPSALIHTSIVTVANSSVYEITDITDAVVGTVVTLKCGAGGANGVRISNTGKFSLLSAAWIPSAGDIIRLMKRADGKFIEVERVSASDSSYQFADNSATPSLYGATEFITGKNTAATEITGFADAEAGKVYTIHGNGDEFASVINTGEHFSLTTASMTLKSGTYIMLTLGSDGKFYEVARG
jgi:hypothetical protein